MRTFIKFFLVIATLLLIGFNMLQYIGITTVVGAAASASGKQEVLVAGMRADLESMIARRGLVRRFEAPGSVGTVDGQGSIPGQGSGPGQGQGQGQGQMVYADGDGMTDRSATALAERLSREVTVGTLSSAGTGIGAAIGMVLSGGMLCVSITIWLAVMLIGVGVLSLTKKSV